MLQPGLPLQVLMQGEPSVGLPSSFTHLLLDAAFTHRVPGRSVIRSAPFTMCSSLKSGQMTDAGLQLRGNAAFRCLAAACRAGGAPLAVRAALNPPSALGWTILPGAAWCQRGPCSWTASSSAAWPQGLASPAVCAALCGKSWVSVQYFGLLDEGA